jgi:hypothetical protein
VNSAVGTLRGQYLGTFTFTSSTLTRLPRVAVVNSMLNSQSEVFNSRIEPSSWHHIFHLHVDIR